MISPRGTDGVAQTATEGLLLVQSWWGSTFVHVECMLCPALMLGVTPTMLGATPTMLGTTPGMLGATPIKIYHLTELLKR